MPILLFKRILRHRHHTTNLTAVVGPFQCIAAESRRRNGTLTHLIAITGPQEAKAGLRV